MLRVLELSLSFLLLFFVVIDVFIDPELKAVMLFIESKS